MNQQDENKFAFVFSINQSNYEKEGENNRFVEKMIDFPRDNIRY